MKKSESLINLEYALQEQEEMQALAAAADKAVKDKEKEKDNKITEAYFNSNSYKREKNRKAYQAFKEDVKLTVLESFLCGIMRECMGNTGIIISDETRGFNHALVSNFIKTEGADELLDRMKTKTRFTSEMAKIIKEDVDEIVNAADPEDPDTFNTTSSGDFYEKLDAEDDISDITDEIRMRVSLATSEFINKNIADKENIKDIMVATKNKISTIATGDEATDEQIAKESTIRMRHQIQKLSERAHGIYEQIVINLSEQVISNDDLKAKFTTGAGQLDMDRIVESANSYYTLLEMVSSLKLKDIDEAYLEEAVKIK